MSSGWIKVHRSLLDWEWYSDEKVFRLFMHCLLSANHKDKRYRGTVIKRGQFLTSQELLGFQTGLSRQSIRKCLKCLKETNELTIDSSSKGTRIEVVNYDKYQNTTNELTSEPTIEQPTNNQQPTTNKNDKNYKKEKEEETASEFLIRNNPELYRSIQRSFTEIDNWDMLIRKFDVEADIRNYELTVKGIGGNLKKYCIAWLIKQREIYASKTSAYPVRKDFDTDDDYNKAVKEYKLANR